MQRRQSEGIALTGKSEGRCPDWAIRGAQRAPRNSRLRVVSTRLFVQEASFAHAVFQESVTIFRAAAQNLSVTL